MACITAWGRLQDGTERCDEPTLDTAVKSLKKFAKSCNNDEIKKKHISYFEEAAVIENKYIKRPIPKKEK